MPESGSLIQRNGRGTRTVKLGDPHDGNYDDPPMRDATTEPMARALIALQSSYMDHSKY
jgi:hypothetical protein